MTKQFSSNTSILFLYKSIVYSMDSSFSTKKLKSMASARISFQNKYRAAAAKHHKRRYYGQQRSHSNDDLLAE